MLAIMGIAMSFTANAAIPVTVQLKGDAANYGRCYFNFYDADYNYVEVVVDPAECANGYTYVLEADDYAYLTINVNNAYISTVTMNDSEQRTEGNYANIYLYGSEHKNIVVDVVSKEESRTAKCIVNVDDASKVSLSYSNGGSVELVDGRNEVVFNPRYESPFSISPNGGSLYKVELNGVEQNAYYGRYQVSVNQKAEGEELDVINITANFPDVDVPVTFTYTDETTKGCVSVKVDGEKVTDFNGESLTVKLGANITLEGDLNNYTFYDSYGYSQYINVDGEDKYFSSGVSFVATKESGHTVAVNAVKNQMYTGYVTVNNPEYISLFVGGYSSYSGEELVVNANEKTAFEVSSTNTVFAWEVADGCYIESITVNGEEISTSSYYVDITDGMEIVINVAAIVRDKKFTLYIDDVTAAPQSYLGCEGMGYMYFSENFQTGENEVMFSEGDNPFRLYINTYMDCTSTEQYVYLNGELQTLSYGALNFTAKDGDRVEVYLLSDPTAIESVEAENGAVEYYNLQGVKVANPEKGIFIKKQGGKATKVVL